MIDTHALGYTQRGTDTTGNVASAATIRIGKYGYTP